MLTLPLGAKVIQRSALEKDGNGKRNDNNKIEDDRAPDWSDGVLVRQRRGGT